VHARRPQQLRARVKLEVCVYTKPWDCATLDCGPSVGGRARRDAGVVHRKRRLRNNDIQGCPFPRSVISLPRRSSSSVMSNVSPSGGAAGGAGGARDAREAERMTTAAADPDCKEPAHCVRREVERWASGTKEGRNSHDAASAVEAIVSAMDETVDAVIDVVDTMRRADGSVDGEAKAALAVAIREVMERHGSHAVFDPEMLGPLLQSSLDALRREAAEDAAAEGASLSEADAEDDHLIALFAAQHAREDEELREQVAAFQERRKRMAATEPKITEADAIAMGCPTREQVDERLAFMNRVGSFPVQFDE